MGDTWHRQERPIGIAVRSGVNPAWIQIRRSDLLLTVDSSGSRDLHRMAAIARDLGDARGAITITRSPIEPRPQCDRAAIVAPSAQNRSDDSPT